MLIACAPGGVTSNVITKFANGDIALSISLTAVTSLISVISVPFIMFSSINFLNIDSISKDTFNGWNCFKNVFCCYSASNNWNVN